MASMCVPVTKLITYKYNPPNPSAWRPAATTAAQDNQGNRNHGRAHTGPAMQCLNSPCSANMHVF